MKQTSAPHNRERSNNADEPATEICPTSKLPVLDDNEPTMPVLCLSEGPEEVGYDPYDTGKFWATR